MAINFFAKDVTYWKVKDLKKNSKQRLSRGIQTSDKVNGVEIRLLPPFVIDNNTKPVLFFPGFAKMYCLTIVVSDANNQLTGGIDLQGFPRIGDNEHLPINKTIFYWQQSNTDTKGPSQIHIMVSILKSKKALRDVGDLLSKLKNDTEYKGIVKQITELTKNTTPVGTALGLVTDIAGLVGKKMIDVDDKPIGTIINSYTSLSGDFDKNGVTHKTYKTKKVNFDVDIIVRNTEVSLSKTTRSPKKSKNQSSASRENKEPVIVELLPII